MNRQCDKPTIWFAGTPPFAAHILQQLLASDDYQITGVMTQPDRPAGRGRQLKASAVKELALQHDIAIAQPQSLTQLPFAALPPPQMLIVVAYGLLLPDFLLAHPSHSCLNVHASILPRWRGAAPIERAIESGDATTGISLMKMGRGLDDGDVWHVADCAIDSNINASELRQKLMYLAATVLLQQLPAILARRITAQPQPQTGISYAHKINKSETKLDWTQDAAVLLNKINAFYPFANSTLNSQMLRIHRAEYADDVKDAQAGSIVAHDKNGICVACGSGALRLTHIQFAGKKVNSAAEIRNARNLNGLQLI